MVANDVEGSKQAIGNVCEAEMQLPCNIVCGAGPYGYLTHAAQYCHITHMGISCYAFLPVCNSH